MVGIELADTLPKVGGYAGGYVVVILIAAKSNVVSIFCLVCSTMQAFRESCCHVHYSTYVIFVVIKNDSWKASFDFRQLPDSYAVLFQR